MFCTGIFLKCGTVPHIFISALNGHAQFHVLAISPTIHKATQAKELVWTLWSQENSLAC
jgi:hypothetical protein